MLSSLAGPVAAAGGTLGAAARRPRQRLRADARPADHGRTAQAALLLRGTVREVDLLACDGRLVAGSVYAGVDARAAAIVDQARWLPGSVQYPYAAMRSLATYRPGRYRLVGRRRRAGGLRGHGRRRELGVLRQGDADRPGASVTDGLLDVVVIEAASRLALMRALPSVYDGSHVDRDEVHVLTGSRVELRGPARGPIPRRRRRRAARRAAGPAPTAPPCVGGAARSAARARSVRAQSGGSPADATTDAQGWGRVPPASPRLPLRHQHGGVPDRGRRSRGRQGPQHLGHLRRRSRAGSPTAAPARSRATTTTGGRRTSR